VSVNNYTVTTNNDRQTLVLPANNQCQHFILTMQLFIKTTTCICDIFGCVKCKRPPFAEQKNSSNAKGFLWRTKWQRRILSERLNWNKIKCL